MKGKQVSFGSQSSTSGHLMPRSFLLAANINPEKDFRRIAYSGAHDATIAAVARAITPDYALGGHTASLGLCWMPAGTLPGFPDGMVIGQHGSWNRSTLSGYKVVFVPFADGRPAGPPRDILGGFLAPDESVSYGRPVGVVLAPGQRLPQQNLPLGVDPSGVLYDSGTRLPIGGGTVTLAPAPGTVCTGWDPRNQVAGATLGGYTVNGNAISIADVDAGGSNNEVTISVTNGTLSLSGIVGLSFTAGDGTADATMTLRGTASAIRRCGLTCATRNRMPSASSIVPMTQRLRNSLSIRSSSTRPSSMGPRKAPRKPTAVCSAMLMPRWPGATACTSREVMAAESEPSTTAQPSTAAVHTGTPSP